MIREQETVESREKALAFFLLSRVTFGKYRGQTWSAVMEFDPNYIVWADDNVEWLKLPTELVAQARNNNTAKKEKGELRQRYDDPFDDDPEDYHEEMSLYGFYDED